jgi:hypothetical protein
MFLNSATTLGANFLAFEMPITIAFTAEKRDELAPPHVSPLALDEALYRLKRLL